jgi:hypothetical protein
MELNPNHQTTSTMHDHWHKIASILLNRIAGKETVITPAEIDRMAGLAITIKDTGLGLELRIVSMAEGEKLARQEGGLPA